MMMMMMMITLRQSFVFSLRMFSFNTPKFTYLFKLFMQKMNRAVVNYRYAAINDNDSISNAPQNTATHHKDRATARMHRQIIRQTVFRSIAAITMSFW